MLLSQIKNLRRHMSQDFAGIQTTGVDLDFIHRQRSAMTPAKLIKRRTLADLSKPSKSDMILDAGYCRKKCEKLHFSPKISESNSQSSYKSFQSCLGVCFSKLREVENFMATPLYTESLIEKLKD